MLENLLEVSDTTFNDRVLDATLPVLVFFWTESSNGCNAMRAPFEQHSAEYANRMHFALYDLDAPEGRETADSYFRKYNIHFPPLMMLFNSGKMVGYAGGYPKGALLENWITRLYGFL